VKLGDSDTVATRSAPAAPSILPLSDKPVTLSFSKGISKPGAGGMQSVVFLDVPSRFNPSLCRLWTSKISSARFLVG